MITILLSFTVIVLVSALVVIHMARTSAEGYEDETGFHFVNAKQAVVASQSRRHSEASLAALTQHPFVIRG
jgi:hypothetical protein